MPTRATLTGSNLARQNNSFVDIFVEPTDDEFRAVLMTVVTFWGTSGYILLISPLHWLAMLVGQDRTRFTVNVNRGT